MAHQDPNELYRQAFTFLQQKRLKEAVGIAHRLRTDHPQSAAAHSLCAQVALAHGNFRQAEKDARLGISLDPHTASQYVLLAEALVGQGGRRDDALAALDEAMRREPGDPQMFDACAAVLTKLDEPRRAVQAYERAVSLAPSSPTAHYNLATAHRFAGNLEAASAAANQALLLKADDYMAATVRSDVHRATPDDNYVDDLQQRLQRPGLSPTAIYHFKFALARELEALGRYDEAFDALNEGAGLRRRGMQYSVEKDVGIMAAIAHCYPRNAIERLRSDYANDRPVFIVGLPRTGTTLLERILQSHSRVASAGEINDFGVLMTRLANQAAPQGELVEASTRIDFEKLGIAYVEATRRFGNDAPRLIDKLPFNFLYCGLIACALPNAAIIHLTRHPMDTGFAIYKTLFAMAYPYSYDLGELGHYYVAYRKLMSHWHDVLPGRILDVPYEALVTDTEAVARRAATHCGIEFEPGMLDYAGSETASKTASASQVRRPVYSSSVDKWRKVEKHLEPYAAILQAAGYWPDE